MGGPNELQIYAESPESGARAREIVVTEVQRIEEKYSRYRSESIISRINAQAGKDPVQVDPETAALLNYAQCCFEQSHGLFDITSGILRRVWNFKEPQVPTKEALSSVVALIGWGGVEWHAPHIWLPREGMEIDFGGIGKEYAADRAAGLCIEAGFRHGLVNLGGDIRILGPQPGGQPWEVGVVHPRKAGAPLASIPLISGAITTSGDYQRFFEVDGVRYCHILNPKTGVPVRELQSVTVCADSCLVAGSACTIAMLLGKKRGQRYLDELGCNYLVVDAEGEVTSHSKKGRISHANKARS